MSFQFVIGPSGSGKTTYLLEKTVAQAAENPRTQYIYIVPDQFTMEMQKAMVLRSPGHAIMNIDVLSFGRMCHRIFEETGYSGETVLDDTGKNLILQRLAIEHRSELSCLGKRVGSPAMIHEIKSTISEFMQYSVGDTQIDEFIKSAQENGRESLALKLLDIKLLYRLFRDEIDGKYTTTEGRMGLLAGVIPESKILENAVLVFDGFTGFTPVQCKVLIELMKVASSTTFAILARKDMSEGSYNPYDLFALSYRTMATLRRCAAAAGEKEIAPVVLGESKRFLTNAALAHIEQNLFVGKHGVREASGVDIAVTANPSEEIAYVGRKILSLVRKEGYAYRDIAVICSDISSYGEGLERELKKRNIPCFIDSSIGIVHDPTLEFIRGAFATIDNDFMPSSVMSMLRSGMGPLDSDEVDFIEYFIERYGIRGRSRWNKEYFGRKINERNKADLERAETDRLLLLQCLGSFTVKKQNAASFCGMIRTLMEVNSLEERSLALAEQVRADGDESRASEIERISENINKVLITMEELCSQEKIELSMFRKLFDAALSEITVGIIPRQVDRVLVGDIERTRLSQVKVLFFLGLNDGLVPKKSSSGGIISDLERELLADKCSDIELAPTSRELVYRQRLYLYMNVTKPTERLYMSYSNADVSGKQMMPSYFVGVIRKLFANLAVRVEKNSPADYMTLSDGLSLLASGLRDYARGFDPGEGDEKPRIIAALYSLCAKDEHYAKLLMKLESAAFYSSRHGKLDGDLARALYGNELSGSVSKFESFANCPFAFFLQYGLKLSDKATGEIDALDIGNLTHEILEKFGTYLEKENMVWAELEDDELEEILALVLRDVYEDPAFEQFEANGKSLYRRDYTGRIANTSVRTLRKQLAAGEFKPVAFEKKFTEKYQLSSEDGGLNGCTLKLNGKIDRIDAFEADGKNYIKIIDYKTGNKSMEYDEIAAGSQIQLPIYLSQSLKLFGESAEAAAMIYYRAQNPIVELDSNADVSVEELFMETLAPQGIANSEPVVVSALASTDEAAKTVIPKDMATASEINDICNYSLKLCRDMAGQILSGEISDFPLEKKSGKNACEYCSFRKYCRFGTVTADATRSKPVKENKVDKLLDYIHDCSEKSGLEGEEE